MVGPIWQRHYLQWAVTFGIVLTFLAQSLAFQQLVRPQRIPAATSRRTSTPPLQRHQHVHRLPTGLLFQNNNAQQFSFSSGYCRSRITLARAARGGIPDHNEGDEHEIRINEDDSPIRPPPAAAKKVVGRRRRRFRKVLVGVAAFWLATFAPLKGYIGIKSASASAPVMAIPKSQRVDPATEAIQDMERRQGVQRQKDLNDMAKQARRIEAEQGVAARIKYEQDYQKNKERQAVEKAAGLIALKKDLLSQGICPFVDMEGQRQVLNYRTGVDLAEAPGTPFYFEKMLSDKNSPKAYSAQMEQQRKVVACMVQDMKNRGVDPVEYFNKHQDKTMSILDLPRDKAAQLVERYTANLELYGQINTPKPGEMSVKEKIEASRDPKAEAKRLKEEKAADAKRVKEEKLAKAAELKAAQKADRERKKEEARLEKEKAKKGKATVMSAASATVALGTSAMHDSASRVTGTLDSAMNMLPDAPTQAQMYSDLDTDDSPSVFGSGGSPSVSNLPSRKTSSSNAPSKKSSSSSVSSKILSPQTFGGIVVIGGGAVAFKMYRDKSAGDERERQRQFQLLMGKSEYATKKTKPIDTSTADMLDDDEEDDDDDDEEDSVDSASWSLPVTTPVEAAVPAKKPRLGMSLFNKKNSRETDIYNLVGASSPNAEFASTLAKLLTFGAPGRFPTVAALPGRMPIEEYSLEAATETLLDVKGDLSQSDTVALFASVVNCMLIDILDLASSALSLKQGKEDATIDALNIVVDFMNHAAELFGAVAGNDVIIDPPVRYEGSLGKAKMEQMFSIYASVGADMSMLLGAQDNEEKPSNIREDHDQRVAMVSGTIALFSPS
jgi:hypothetical protein